SVRHHNQYFFPLLLLPIKLIVKVLSFLPLRDRLRARVNRKLHEIEAGEKWKFHTLYIWAHEYSQGIPRSDSFYITITKTSQIYFDGLKKIAENCVFKGIDIEFSNLRYADVFHFVSNVKARILQIATLDNRPDTNDHYGLLNQRDIERIMEGRIYFGLYGSWNVISSFNVDYILEICEIVESGLESLQAFFMHELPSSIARVVAAEYGLRVNSKGEFVTTNKDLELYLDIESQYVIRINNLLMYIDEFPPGTFGVARLIKNRAMSPQSTLSKMNIFRLDESELHFVEEFSDDEEEKEDEDEE
ncbi:hypothetical protein PENTCL1PPCAC_26174, partial [Pristionchus entomophagus]